MTQPTNISLEASEAQAEISEILALAETFKSSPEIVNRFLDLLDSGLEVCRIETAPAFGAGELRYRAKLPDGLGEFVTALRTGNLDGFIKV